MQIRKLESKDAKYMLEWMHDDNVVEFFEVDFSKKTMDDVENFIVNSFTDTNKHFAIVNDFDEYMGTISLKNIDLVNKNAEYAISIRSSAMGMGISRIGTDMLLEYAFNELKLERVYLCVAEDNIRAIKFYEKYGFIYEGKFTNHILRDNKFIDLKWYYILNREGRN